MKSNLRVWVVSAILCLLPHPASADRITNLLDWLGQHFRIRIVKLSTLTAFRGGRDAAGSLWLVPSDGGSARPLGTATDYRLALFLADGTLVALQRNDRLVHLRVADGSPIGTACAVGKDAIDVAFAGSDPSIVGLVTRRGSILELKLTTCRQRQVQSLPKDTQQADQIRGSLEGLARSCEGRQLATVEQEQDLERGTRRQDVVIRAGEERARPLTSAAPLTVHRAPAFSQDCRLVAYLASDATL